MATSKPIFSDKEMKVLQLVAAGKSYKEIAEEMEISVNTVKAFRARIGFKLRGTGMRLRDLQEVLPGLIDEDGNLKIF